MNPKSNHRDALDAGRARYLHIWHHLLDASDRGRWTG
jgi:hypothetical protein